MAATITAPGHLIGNQTKVLGKLSALSMTATAAAYNVVNNGSNTLLLLFVTFSNFSSFPVGASLPSSFAYSWGCNSTTAPTDMRTSTTFGAAANAPLIIVQNLTTTQSYIGPGSAFYFAVTANTGGLGTMDVTFIGFILATP